MKNLTKVVLVIVLIAVVSSLVYLQLEIENLNPKHSGVVTTPTPNSSAVANTPTPNFTPSPILPENSSSQAELFYVYELFLKPGLYVNNLTVDTIPGYHLNSFYDYQANESNGWLQIGFDSNVTSIIQTNLDAICDSRGYQSYTWYIPLNTVNNYDSLRGRPILISSGLPAFGEAIKW